MTAVLATSAVGASGARRPSVGAVHRAFRDYDLNGDGRAEIRWVRSLDIGSRPQFRRRGSVLVLVEPRLLERGDGLLSLRPSLRTFSRDLAAEGWRVIGASMQVYDGPIHQDGRTLLAMREYLRRLRVAVPDLAGVVIVGSFPEAMLVRQYNWRQYAPTTFHAGTLHAEDFGGRAVHRIRSVAEIVAYRAELVLSDLDGNWERLYHEGPEDLPRVLAAYPDLVLPEGGDPEGEWHRGGRTRHFERGVDRYSDFFFVNDGRFRADPAPDGAITLVPLDEQRDDECSAEDRQRGNPMARPDILVSRIDARHVALRPKASVRGTAGEGLLDAQGRPQTVTFETEKETPSGPSVWEWDPALERRLLTEYFERNHRYRTGALKAHVRPAAAAHGLDSPMDSLREARPEWRAFDEPGYDLHGDSASLLEFVQWLKRPAVLRSISAHSDAWGCHFAPTDDVAALESECGGQPWSWVRRGNQLVPTLGATGKMDFAIARTLWQNGALPDTASFFLHWGCEATAPGGAASVPYNHPDYGHWQGAEALLFYCKGLALVGRAKVFYDFPTDFAKVLGEGKTFGEAWAHYFALESAEKDVRKVGGGIGRKRAYFWSVLGDWTLRLLPPEGEDAGP